MEVPNPIGHIIISADRPARPDEFWITIDNPEAGLEVGSIIVAEGNNRRVVGVVDTIEHASRSSSVSQWYEHRVEGSRAIEPSVRYPVEQYAHVRVLARDPPVKSPPSGRWTVRHMMAKDANVLFKRIPEHHRILAGFFKGRELVPIYLHAQFLLGPEGAHINITGKTGLATKTSYAVFLAHAILSWARRTGERVAVVMFNVKRGDLMRLHIRPKDMEEATRRLEIWAGEVGMSEYAPLMVKLWEKAVEEGLDPFNTRIRYFTYSGDQFCDWGHGDVVRYFYGLGNLTPGEVIAAIYSPGEKVPDTQRNMLYTYFDALGDRMVSFDEMRSHFRQYADYRPEAAERYNLYREGLPRIGRWRTDVADAIYRRLDGFLRRATHVVIKDRPVGNPIRFRKLGEGMINVVQLFGLDEAEKRLVVNALLREILVGLQRRREERHLDRVFVFVDELNVYAPRAESPIKEQVLEIVARGRDLYLSLCGAQQFASQVDSQVYGNCSTKVVGNSDFAEIESGIYRFLGGFKSIVPYLDKGEMIIYHPLYASPVPVIFPVPLHEVMGEAGVAP